MSNTEFQVKLFILINKFSKIEINNCSLEIVHKNGTNNIDMIINNSFVDVKSFYSKKTKLKSISSVIKLNNFFVKRAVFDILKQTDLIISQSYIENLSLQIEDNCLAANDKITKNENKLNSSVSFDFDAFAYNTKFYLYHNASLILNSLNKVSTKEYNRENKIKILGSSESENSNFINFAEGFCFVKKKSYIFENHPKEKDLKIDMDYSISAFKPCFNSYLKIQVKIEKNRR